MREKGREDLIHIKEKRITQLPPRSLINYTVQLHSLLQLCLLSAAHPTLAVQCYVFVMLNWCTRLFSLLAAEFHICSYQLFLIFIQTFLRIYRAINLSNLVAFLGNSANQAIELLIQKGVPESHIIFLNLISVSYFFFLLISKCLFSLQCLYTPTLLLFS